jgi:flagellar motility protein MotE (MotC chaperone)
MNTIPRKPRPKLERAPATHGARGPVFRILPIVIVAAVCLLGLRVQVVVSDLTKTGASPTVAVEQSTALAQTQPAAPAQPAAPGAPAAEGAEGAEQPADGAPADGAEGAAAAPEESMAVKPSELTQSEIETLQRLSERRETIERRERELQQKESLLKAAEQRMDQKIGQMQAIEKQLQGLVQQYDAKKKAEIEQLVKIYTAMKPKDAARIFDELDMNILLSVVTTMKENKVAPILSQMNAEKARQLTEEMSSRRQIPGVTPGQQG